MVRDQLVERARDFDIILEDVAITDLSFSPQYTAAVEAKQIGRYRGGDCSKWICSKQHSQRLMYCN